MCCCLMKPSSWNWLFVECDGQTKRDEYAELVTNLPDEVHPLAQLYRDRADAENVFGELKNQWGWRRHHDARHQALPPDRRGCGAD